jgi:hypothetical protein
MGGGRGTLTPTPTVPIAIVGTGPAIIMVKSTAPQITFFILLPPIYIFGLHFFPTHDQQDNAAHECYTADNRRQGNRSGFLRRHFQRTEINDILSGRIGNPLVSKGRDSYSNQYDGNNYR